MKVVVVLLITVCVSLIWALPQSVSDHQPSSSRIVGGHPARLGEFPFVVAIEARTTNAKHFCAGTLLNNQWVLTAGHCIHESIGLTVHLGTTTLDEHQDSAITVSTLHYEVHPQYNGGLLQNDIGLLRFNQPIQFGDYIKPISYFPDDHAYDYSAATVVGWGQTSDSTPGPVNNLNAVQVLIIPNTECQRTYGNQITDHMVCSQGNSNEGICIGDSGGPLVHQVGWDFYVIVGVVLFHSINGCETPEPSGYTRVYTYMDWIKNVTGIEEFRHFGRN